jgi:stress-induced-phosphoprotein 1
VTDEEIKERQARSMQDPEVQSILKDPLMQSILNDLQVGVGVWVFA